MNNISIWISILSLLLSISSAFYTWYQQHLPIQYSLDWICNIANGRQLDFGMTFVNPSSKPRIILDLSYVADTKSQPQHTTWAPCKLLKLENTVTVNGKIKRTSYKEAFSDSLPIVVAPYSAKTVVLAVLNAKITDNQRFMNLDIKIDSSISNINLPIKSKISTSSLKSYIQSRLIN